MTDYDVMALAGCDVDNFEKQKKIIANQKKLIRKAIKVINELTDEVNYYSGDLAEHLCHEDEDARQDEFDETDKLIQKAWEFIGELKKAVR